MCARVPWEGCYLPSGDVPLSKGGEKLRGGKFGLGNGMGGCGTK